VPSGADHAPGEVRGHPAPPDARAARVLKCHRVPRRRPRGALPATPFLALASDGNPRAGQHALDRWATRVGLSRPRTAAGAQAQAPCPAAGFRARGEGSFFCQLGKPYQPAAFACRCSCSKCECQRLSEQGPAYILSAQYYIAPLPKEKSSSVGMDLTKPVPRSRALPMHSAPSVRLSPFTRGLGAPGQRDVGAAGTLLGAPNEIAA